MNNSTRNLLIAGGAILLVGCLCMVVLGVGGLSFFAINRSSQVGPTVVVDFSTYVLPSETIDAPEFTETSPEPSSTPPAQPGTETDPPPQATSPTSQSDLSPEIAEQMDQIEDQVVELRGLQPNGSVSRALLSPSQLRQRVIDDFLEDYEETEAQEDSIVLAVFGLLEPGFDLYDLYLELFSEQIAGFYDNETKEMYVIQGEGFQGPERLTYAHEYTHALQDQNYDFEDGLQYNDKTCEEDSERCAAIQALVEGDASLAELEWLSNFATNQDFLEIQEFYNSYESPVYDNAPAFLQEDFLFPYTYGQGFVEYLHNRGGWSAVDAAFQDLPVSTEQILHPERYPDDKPVPVSLLDLSSVLGEGWREIDRGVMGEWYTYLILALGVDPGARLTEGMALDASDGWGGDSYVVYHNDSTNETAMVLKHQWETGSDAIEFKSGFEEYTTRRLGSPDQTQADLLAWDGPEGYTALYIDGLNTTWLVAPDGDRANSILEAINSP